MIQAVRTEAPAKVNLQLRVLGRRPDGYHEIQTVFQAVDLCDEVRVDPVGTRVELTVTGADVGPPEQNLAFRAATGFFERAPAEVVLPTGCRVELVKRVPAGAGLGGGSSDAAAVLRSLSHLTRVPLPSSWVTELAADLGSDVPFFLGTAATAAGGGRGEVLTPLPALPEAHLVLALPPVHVATGEAYRTLAAARSAHVEPRSDLRQEWPATVDWRQVSGWMHNDFQKVIAPIHPAVRQSIDGLVRQGALAALLSGSGGASFGVFESRVEAVAAAFELQERDWVGASSRPGP